VLLINAEETGGAADTPAGWQQFIQTQQLQYSIILVVNTPLQTHPGAMVPMAQATLNLLVLDSRSTARQYITRADMLQQQLQLPAMQFVLNRAGYTPSLLRQLKSLLLHAFTKHKP